MSFEAVDDNDDFFKLFEDDETSLSDIPSPFDPNKPNADPSPIVSDQNPTTLNIGSVMREAQYVSETNNFPIQTMKYDDDGSESNVLIKDPFLPDAQKQYDPQNPFQFATSDHTYPVPDNIRELLPIIRRIDSFPDSQHINSNQENSTHMYNRAFSTPTSELLSPTKSWIRHQLNDIAYNGDAIRLLNFYYAIFRQRPPFGNEFEFCQKFGLKIFMQQDSLDIPSAFDSIQMTRTLTEPFTSSRKDLAKACFELVLGRHLWITINSFEQIDIFDYLHRTRYYALVWYDYTRVLKKLKVVEFMEHGWVLWIEIWSKYFRQFQELISAKNSNLAKVFSNNQQMLEQFIGCHADIMTLLGGATFESRFSIRALLASDNLSVKKQLKRKVESERPTESHELERPTESHELERPTSHNQGLPKKPRLAPNPSPDHFLANLLFFDEENVKNGENPPSIMVTVNFNWRSLVPSAANLFSNENPPKVFMMLSYTQRSDSGLIVWVTTPDGRVIHHSYNTSKNNDQAKKGTLAGYYECEHCEKKSFKLVIDIGDAYASLVIPNSENPKEESASIELEHHECGTIASENSPENLNEILYGIASGKAKAMCKCGQVLTIDDAEAKLLENCQRICANISNCDYFPKWVSEAFNMSYVLWELQVNWRQKWPDDDEEILLEKKVVREQAFGRLIKKVRYDAYWSQLFYDAISRIVKNPAERAKLAYEASRFLKYAEVSSISGSAESADMAMRATALEGLYNMGFSRKKIEWDNISSIIVKYEKGSKLTKKEGRSIKIPTDFVVPKWFSEHWRDDPDSELATLRRGLEKIAFANK